MMSRRLPALVVVVGIIGLLAGARLKASGPEFDTAKTFASEWPAFPSTFAAGKLGVFKPGFDYDSLITAYRVLKGHLPRPVAPGTPVVQYEADDMLFWAAVDRVSSSPRPRIDSWRVLPDYSSFTNCTSTTWKAALSTLDSRIARYGPASSEVAEWLSGQMDVLRNCNGKELVVPRPVPSWADAMLRADREYQIASAYFYAMQYEEAARRFTTIAGDATSSWRPYGRYLAARAMLRQATVVANGPEAALLSQAQSQLQRVLGDPQAASLHASAQALLHFLAARLRPAERMHELAERLASSDEPTSEDRTDFIWLLRRNTLAPAQSTDDLTDWLITFRSEGDVAAEHAMGRWRQTHSDAWLVAAAWSAAPEKMPPDLQSALAAVPQNSPVFATVMALRLRVLIAQQRRSEASRLLATLPSRANGVVDQELINLIRASRLRLAPTFNVFLDNAMRKTIGDDSPEPMLDDDVSMVFNRYLPLDQWVEAATSDRLTRRVRIRLAQIAFTRAAVLQRHDIAMRVAPILAELAPTLRQDLSAFMQAPDGPAKHRAAVLLLLRTPGMTLAAWGLEDSGTPDVPYRSYRSFESYWWCSPEVRPTSDLTAFLFGNTFEAPRFLSAADRARAARDLKALAEGGDGARYLVNEALAWARSVPDDPLVPEALSRAVRGWRYVRCLEYDPKTGWPSLAVKESSLPKRAFQLLHTRYRASDWARRTPYWYE